ncbi:MAG: D-2-hydroxyacid dehydrogenase [Oscillospiraceae bacterium]|nr:D-2-hydroxyacid dehydrogenase [Oscillospiraceae bacterium]
MKIVVLDGYCENPGDLSWAPLEQFGEVVVYDRTPDTAEAVIERLKDADILVGNKNTITGEIMDACPNLKYIAVQATGYNVIDVAAAKERGIPVSNVPTYGTMAVAQHTMALLLEITNGVGHHSDAVHAGRWQTSPDWCFWDHPLMELDGKTMGIIGFGKIGQQTGRLAKAFGMKVLAAGSRPTDEGRAIAEYVEVDELLAKSDVISLHCPLFPNTKDIIRKENIDKMKDGVIILNSSRGGLVVEQDLADALASGKVYAAAVDVVSSEPMKDGNPLLTAPNCIITPHIAWAPKEARQRIMNTTAKNIEAFLSGNPINVVNQ